MGVHSTTATSKQIDAPSIANTSPFTHCKVSHVSIVTRGIHTAPLHVFSSQLLSSLPLQTLLPFVNRTTQAAERARQLEVDNRVLTDTVEELKRRIVALSLQSASHKQVTCN